jgi:hypothetical protein
MRARLSATVTGLRRGLAGVRALHAGLRAEAAELRGFIPVLADGARTGVAQGLAAQAQQHSPCAAACKRHSSLLRPSCLQQRRLWRVWRSGGWQDLGN